MRQKKIFVFFFALSILLVTSFLAHPLAVKAGACRCATKTYSDCYIGANNQQDCDKQAAQNKQYEFCGYFTENKNCEAFVQNGGRVLGIDSQTQKQLEEDKIKFQAVAPALEISIPTLKPFTTSGIKQPDEFGYIYIPFLGQYIVGIFRWALLVAGVVAVILMMAGGFLYMTAGGNKQRVDQGKERILHALWGLLLLLGSYTILYIINPGLVEFRSLKIKVIERINLEDLVLPDEDKTPQDSGAKNFSTTDYDQIFQKYAQCSGINWMLMKAIAHHESGLNPAAKNPNSSATGLFQAMAGKNNDTCKKVLNSVGMQSQCDSPGLTDPTVNTAYATLIFKASISTIKGKCSSASFNDKVFMLYFGHGSGPGALKEAIRQFSCDTSKWPNTPWPAGTAYGLTGKPIFRGASQQYTQKIVSKINGFGINTFDGPGGSCPIK